MVLREQALDTHPSLLLLVQQAALSPQYGDKHKKHLADNHTEYRMLKSFASIRLFFMFTP